MGGIHWEAYWRRARKDAKVRQREATNPTSPRGLSRFDPRLEEMCDLSRERIHREGGISHEHAKELGYESVAELHGLTL
jgi:hypothetical protein